MLLEEQSWLFSLTVHFQEWLIGISIICIVLTAIEKKQWLLKFSFIFLALIFHTLSVLPFWNLEFDQKSKSALTRNIKVFYSNLNSRNKEKQKLIHFLQHEQPELSLLVEFNSNWADEIKSLESIYLYSKAIIKNGNFGMLALSKTPLQVINVYFDKEHMIPAMFLKTQILTQQGTYQNLKIALLHPHPPIGKYGTLLRDQYLNTIAQYINDLDGSSIICGDFNTTPWSHIFQKFLKDSGLKFSDHQSLIRTWPTSTLIPSLPIDHCLSRGVKIVKYKRGPDIGSDHWPLTFEIENATIIVETN